MISSKKVLLSVKLMIFFFSLDLQTGFISMVEVKSYAYKKLSLVYGINGTSLVRSYYNP